MRVTGEALAVDGRTVVVRAARLAEILALRHAELRPGLPRVAAEFAGDADAATRHFGAFVGMAGASAAEAVACASFVRSRRDGEPAYQLRGMATRADLARRGIGGALLRFALAAIATAEGTRLFWCNARIGAVPFYRRMGWWAIASEPFDVPSVGPHRVMTFRLDDAGG